MLSGHIPPGRGVAALPPPVVHFLQSTSLTFPVFTLSRLLRSVLPVAFALSLTAAPRASHAQTSLNTSFALDLEHVSHAPYNFTGRIFVLDDATIGFGSGTLIRRHTVLTAGHVVYDTAAGFIANATFSRGLLEDYTFQKYQVISAMALTGYQAAATANTEDSINAFAFDMGVVLVNDPPRDKTWGNYIVEPTVLASSTNQFFQLGYPGVSFDGRTMAYIVPTSTFTQVGGITSGGVNSGLYENDGYLGEPGESGGPIYAYTIDPGTNTREQLVVGEYLGGIADTSGEFNASFVRTINNAANTFITSAEYTAGLIKKVKIKGPRTVTHGTTVIYTAVPQFTNPDFGSTTLVTTDRYTEVKLKTSTPGITTQPVVTIKKLSYTKFAVTFAATIRPRSTTTLSAYFSKTAAVANSTITIMVQ